jgi:hypothetical protein
MNDLLKIQERVDQRTAEENKANATLFAAEEAFKKGRGIRYGIQGRFNSISKQHVQTSQALFTAMVEEKDSVSKPLRSQLENLAREKSVLSRALTYWDHWTGRDLEAAVISAKAESLEAEAQQKGEQANLVQAWVASKLDEINAVDKNLKIVAEGPGERNMQSEKLKKVSHSLFLEAQTRRIERIEFDKQTLQGQTDNARILN